MLAVNQENEKLMEEYEKLASEVRQATEASPSRPCSPIPALLFLPSQLTPSLDCRAHLSSE